MKHLLHQTPLARPLSPKNYLVSPKMELGGAIAFYAKPVDPDYPDEKIGVFVSTSDNQGFQEVESHR